MGHVLTDRSFCPRQFLPIGEPVSKEVSAQAMEAATLLLELAREVLRKATGRPKHQERWGSQEHGQNPFAQV